MILPPGRPEAYGGRQVLGNQEGGEKEVDLPHLADSGDTGRQCQDSIEDIFGLAEPEGEATHEDDHRDELGEGQVHRFTEALSAGR